MKKIIYLLFVTLFSLSSLACTQRITADVSARVEEGYVVEGQSVSIGTLPLANGEGLLLPEDLSIKLKQNLVNKGYSLRTEDDSKPAAVHVRLYWQSFGPYISIEENPLWDFDLGGRGPWRRERYTKKEEYLRTLIIEAWANNLAPDEEANAQGLAPFLQKKLTYKEAISYLPKEPARLLWRVESKSMGNLSKAEKILPELLESALPWIARSVSVRVLTQDEGAKIIVDERDSIMPMAY